MVIYFFLFILTCLKINMSYGSMYSIILPTYNEKNNVPYIIYMIIDELSKKKINYEIILVDDNSEDLTADIYKKLQLTFPNEKLLLLQREKKSGIGSAYIDALKIISGDYVIIMDADLSHHPKYIYEFIKKQKETNCDIVSGSRYNKDGGIFGWGFKRILISRVANFLSQFLLFINLTDLTGSFRLYKTDVLKEIIQNIQGKGFSFQMEVIVRAHKKGKKIEEVGYIFYNRLFGESKLASNDIFQYLFCLLRLFWTL